MASLFVVAHDPANPTGAGRLYVLANTRNDTEGWPDGIRGSYATLYRRAISAPSRNLRFRQYISTQGSAPERA